VVGDDGRRYWLKLRASDQGPLVPVTEQIVARVGSLIGAPTCHVVRMGITVDHDGTTLSSGKVLHVGVEHASLDVSGALWESGTAVQRSKDDNARRYVGWMALYDWCWGGDMQFLYDPGNDDQFVSHDHGWYLPPVGSTWTANDMVTFADLPHPLADPTNHCTLDMALETAGRLRGVTRTDLVDTLVMIPASWSATDDDLEAVGYFLERRAEQVAERLLQTFGGANAI
jgi:hypothetical protein